MTQTISFLAEDVFSIKGRGVVVTGQLQSGTLFPGMKATVNGKPTQVADIETFRKKIDNLQPGINAGIMLPNLERNDLTSYIAYFPGFHSHGNSQRQYRSKNIYCATATSNFRNYHSILTILLISPDPSN